MTSTPAPEHPEAVHPRPAGPSRPGAPAVAQQADVAPVSGPVSAPGAGQVGVRFEARTHAGLSIDELLRRMVAAGASDMHLSVGSPPLMRLHGDMQPIPGFPVLDDALVESALRPIISDDQWNRFETTWELDLAYTVDDEFRFRVNVFRQRAHVGAVFRSIPSDIKPLEALGLPPVLYNFAGLPRGLVLVTGPTGSGKSTTLASLIDRANRTRSGHIMTIEDPIEFVHDHRSCVVNQREVGSDTHGFTEALKHVLRQDPDIILIGELRDLETISTALTAAETGHLVFATLHTQSAQDTVNRIIDVFPAEQQQQIRSQLAATLRGVICQTLVKRADGSGRAVAAEILVVNTAIAQLIRKGDTHQIPQALQSGGELGMRTLNQNLAELVNSETITRETAEEFATDAKDLDALINGGGRRRSAGARGGFGGAPDLNSMSGSFGAGGSM